MSETLWMEPMDKDLIHQGGSEMVIPIIEGFGQAFDVGLVPGSRDRLCWLGHVVLSEAVVVIRA